MAVTIDAISPNSVCIQDYKKSSPPPVKAEPSHPVCEVKVALSLPGQNQAHSLRFIKNALQFELARDNDAATVALLLQSGWNPQDARFQALLLQAIPLHWVWENNYREGYLVKENQKPIEGAEILFQRLANFLILGSFQDSAHVSQQENFQKIVEACVILKPTEKAFLSRNLSLQLEEDVTRRLPVEVVERMKWLKSMVDFLIHLESDLVISMGVEEVSQEIHQAEKLLIGYLFSNQPKFEDLRLSLKNAAENLYKSEIRFYERLVKSLSSFEAVSELSRNQNYPARLAVLKQWLQQPARAKELEYGRLTPQEALKASVLDSLKPIEARRLLAAGVLNWIGPPQFTPEWIGTEDHLPKIVNNIFKNIEMTEDKQGKMSLNAEKLKLLGWQLNLVLDQHSIQTREYAAGLLAVLIHLFGAPPKNQIQWKVYWKGEVRDILIHLEGDHLKTIGSAYYLLKSKIQVSVSQTETNLPLAEAGICAVGTGMTIWGVTRQQENGNLRDPVLLTGSGVAGFGCGAWLTHYVYPTRNPYISDSIGGGLAALLGVGIPLLLSYSFERENENVSPVVPEPIPKPDPEPEPEPEPTPRPIDGRNPTDSFGP